MTSPPNAKLATARAMPGNVSPTADAHGTPRPRWTAVLQAVVLNVLAWAVISAAGAYGAASATSFLRLWQQWCIDYLPMLLMSAALCLALLRWPTLFEPWRNIVGFFIVVMVVFQPLQWLYVDWVRHGGDVAGINLENIYQARLRMRRFSWFVTGATFAIIVGIGNWRLARARERALQRTHTHNLELSLALEQQRMLSLRAQLEPHFIFNALNAISALVRDGDKAVSLQGISRLSDLLRYALSASLRDTVRLGEELQFIHDYTDLQRLRYGDRLHIDIHCDDAALHEAQCPPLLLQPLIENALRHDLDGHDGRSDIRVHITRHNSELLMTVSNPLSAQAPANPGTGLGLKNTRERLMMFNPAASLHTETRGDRFYAAIRLPLGDWD
ncbi:histidine kinase [Duganella dendranthematis]|uniref:Histidine kinase n=1 Tax=Duganella dendranthematis TaxID=2728021 RepID=A0ABX6M730_9BURK|nr:histidine kinase [Duganella dendranthematis]QJD90114.1 histidine kinase [Duganella dendranthematis]